MPVRSLMPIEYRGELAALASTERFHIIAPWLLARRRGDAEVRFVAFMCLAFRESQAGRLPGRFTSELAERWARAALIDMAALVVEFGSSDADLAERWNVPREQVRLARAELSER